MSQTSWRTRTDRSNAATQETGRGKIGEASPFRFFLVAGMMLGALFIVLGQPFLPAKYLYDGRTIQNVANGLRDYSSDRSFQGIGELYRFIGLADKPVAAGLLAYILYAWLVYRAATELDTSTLDIATAACFVATASLGAVFLGQYSKDAVVLAIVAAVMSRAASWKWDILLLAGIAYYAYSFRNYWYLVGILYLFFRWYTRSEINRARLGVSVPVLMAGLAVAFSVKLGVDLDHYRDLVNVNRSGSVDAQTLIHSLIPINGWIGGWSNSLITLVGLVFPFPLVLLGGLVHLVVAAFVTVVWLRFNRSVGILTRLHAFEPRTRRILSLVIAFILIQSIFEPDYGSYLRHLTPILPAILLIIAKGSFVSNLNSSLAGTAASSLQETRTVVKSVVTTRRNVGEAESGASITEREDIVS